VRIGWKLGIAAGLVIAGVGLVEFGARSIAVDRLDALLEKDLAEALGATVSVRELRLSLLPWPVLRARGLKAVNFPDDSSLRELHFDKVRLGVAWRGLLRRSFLIRSLRVSGAKVVIERGAALRSVAPKHPQVLVSDPGEDPLNLQIRRLSVEHLTVAYRDRRSGEVRELEFVSLEMRSKGLETPVHVRAAGTFEGAHFDVKGQLGSIAELRAEKDPYPISLSGRVFEAQVTFQGTVAHPAELTGLDLELTAQLPVLEIEGITLPDLEDIELRAHLSDLDGSLGLDVQIETPAEDPVELKIDGSVDDLVAASEMDVTAHAKADNLDFLEPLVGADLPDVEDWSVDARVTDATGKLALTGGARARALGGAIVIEAQGEIQNLAAFREVDLHLKVRADHLGHLAHWLSWERGAPEFGPVDVRARLHDENGVLALDPVRASLDHDRAWAKVEGKVGRWRQLEDVDLHLAFRVADSGELMRSFGKQLPALGPLEGRAVVQDRDGALGIENIELELGGAGPLRAKASGNFDDLRKRDEISADLHMQIADLAIVGELFDRVWPQIGPIEFTGHVEGSDEELTAQRFELRSGQSEFQGSATASFAPGARPSLQARVATEKLRLVDIGINPEFESGQRIARPPQRLPLEELRALDLSLELRATQVVGVVEFDIRDATMDLSLQDGDLIVKNTGARWQGGHVDARLRIDTRTPDADHTVSVEAVGIAMDKILAQVDQNADDAGLLDIQLDLQAAGDTPAAIRSSLAGTASAVLHDGVVASTFARAFLIDLGEAVFRSFTRPKKPRIGCAAGKFRVDAGIARVETLMLEGNDVTVTGTGQIDLVRERFDLLLVPSALKRGMVSVSPSVQVVGPLAEPEFRPVKRTFATSLGRGVVQGVYNLAKQPIRVVLPRSEIIKESRAACAKLGRAKTRASR